MHSMGRVAFSRRRSHSRHRQGMTAERPSTGRMLKLPWARLKKVYTLIMQTDRRHRIMELMCRNPVSRMTSRLCCSKDRMGKRVLR